MSFRKIYKILGLNYLTLKKVIAKNGVGSPPTLTPPPPIKKEKVMEK